MWIILNYFILQSYLEINFKFLRACTKLERCLNVSEKKKNKTPYLMVVYQIKKGILRTIFDIFIYNQKEEI